MGISALACRYGVNGQTLRRQYKEKISGYRQWDQLSHAGEYLLFPENVGADMSLDETCLSNGEVYTVLTDKSARGRKGALAAIIRGVATDKVSAVLLKLPRERRKAVRSITTDLSSAMMLTARRAFPAAKLVNDRFHVQQLMSGGRPVAHTLPLAGARRREQGHARPPRETESRTLEAGTGGHRFMGARPDGQWGNPSANHGQEQACHPQA